MATPNKPTKAKTAVPAPAAPKAPAKPAKVDGLGKSHEPSQEEIQARAFEIYLAEGRKPGSDLENWLRAEKELRGRSSH